MWLGVNLEIEDEREQVGKFTKDSRFPAVFQVTFWSKGMYM